MDKADQMPAITHTTPATARPPRRRRRHSLRKRVRAGAWTLGLLTLLAGWMAFAAHLNGVFDRPTRAHAQLRVERPPAIATRNHAGPQRTTVSKPRRTWLAGATSLETLPIASEQPQTTPAPGAVELCDNRYLFGDEAVLSPTAENNAADTPAPVGNNEASETEERPYTPSRPRSLAQGEDNDPPDIIPIPGSSGTTPALTAARRAISPTPLRFGLLTPSFLPGGFGGGGGTGGRAGFDASGGARTPPAATPANTSATRQTPSPAPAGVATEEAGDPPQGRNATGTGPLLVAGSTLDGTDPIDVPVVVTAGGTINPGHSPGSLSLGADLDIDGGRLIVEIAGATRGQYDQLLVGGEAFLKDVVIEFRLLDGFVPAEGDLFDFLRAEGGIQALDIASVEMTGLPATLGFALIPEIDLQRDLLVGLSVQITAAQLAAFASVTRSVAVPLPATLLLVAPALLLLAFRHRRRPAGSNAGRQQQACRDDSS